MTALLLLLPSTPMLFQGQEFAASSRFLYFADHDGELAEAVRKGRAEFVAQFPSLATRQAQAAIPRPDDRETFERCKLQWEEWTVNQWSRRLHCDLLALRRSDFGSPASRDGVSTDGAVIGSDAFVLRYTTSNPRDERLLVVNLGPDLVAASLAEPLVAAPDEHIWQMRWSSEDVTYGGAGAYPVITTDGWRVPGHSTTVLAAVEGGHGGTHRG